MKQINYKIIEGFREQDIKPIYDLLVKDTLYGYGTYSNKKEGQAYMLKISSEEAISEWKNDFIVTIYDDTGFLIGFGRAKSDCWITHVFIDETYQKKGYGKIILEYLEKKLAEHSCKTIQLTSEPKVVDFYKKYGYKITQDEPMEYHGLLLVPMEKVLE